MAKPKMTLREYCEKNPDRAYLLDEWDYEANGELTPDNIGYGSHKKVSWSLPYNVAGDYPIEHLRGKNFDFKWRETVSNRARKKYGCPYLSGREVFIGFNDLATTHPELTKEWNFVKNGTLKPTDMTAGSNKKVWWMLEYKVPEDYRFKSLRGKTFLFEWETWIPDRTQKGRGGCPYLSGHAIWTGFNDLATTHPELAKQWHPIKNGDLRPDAVTYGYDKKVWWLLPYDVPMDYPVKHLRGKHFDFEWEASVSSRTNIRKGRKNTTGCPFLATSNSQVWSGFNDLATTHPEHAMHWHPTKNGELTPELISKGNIRKEIWWLLPYDVPMDYPIEHLRGKHFDFEWTSGVATKLKSKFLGCPFLDTASSPALWVGFNDLATRYPEIAKEWHPTRNGNLSPSDVTGGMATEIWWQCEKGHEWRAPVYTRTAGNSCPICTESKGEKAIRKILEDNHILFKEQYKFKDRCGTSGKQLLRDDFAVFDNDGNVISTIEYNGKQHYEPVDFASRGDLWAKTQFKITQQNDKIKSDYLKAHNVPQLIIPYWELDNIENKVVEFLQKLKLMK